jgi:hypothetical protein
MSARSSGVVAGALMFFSLAPLSYAKAWCAGPWKPMNANGFGEPSSCSCDGLSGWVSLNTPDEWGTISANGGSGQVRLELGGYGFARRQSNGSYLIAYPNSWIGEEVLMYDMDDFWWTEEYRAVCLP